MKKTSGLLLLFFLATTLRGQTLIPFNKGDLVGFKDSLTKKIVIIPQFENKLSYYDSEPPNANIYPKYVFKNGYCICRKKGEYGIIDKKNKVIIPFKFNEIRETSDPNKYLIYAGTYDLKLGRNMTLEEFNAYCGLKFERLKWAYIDITGKILSYKDE